MLFSVLIGMCALAMEFSIGIIIIVCYFILGLNQKKQDYLRPMVTWMALCTVSSLLNFVLPFYNFAFAVTVTIIYAYEFIVVHSIHRKFYGEFSETPPVYYQPRIENV